MAAIAPDSFNRYRGDVVLNPFEPASVKWDPLAEIQSSYDAAELASGLIPSSSDPGARMNGARMRALFSPPSSGVAARLNSAGPERAVAAARRRISARSFSPWSRGPRPSRFSSSRTPACSVRYDQWPYRRSRLSSTCKHQRAAPFAVRQWVRCGHSSGALFIPYKANQIAALKSMIATWMRLAIFEALSGEENQDQRLWFVIDELDALGAIDGLKDALATAPQIRRPLRLGLSINCPGLQHVWRGRRANLIENCGNTLILRCSGSENGGTSQFASRLIGEREVLRQQVSRGSDRESPFPARLPALENTSRATRDGSGGHAIARSNNCPISAAI